LTPIYILASHTEVKILTEVVANVTYRVEDNTYLQSEITLRGNDYGWKCA
jgi:hypothetical protein